MSAILIDRVPVPDVVSSRLSKWLNSPECDTFVEVLRSEAADYAAQSGNSLAEGEGFNEEDAKESAIKCGFYTRMADEIVKLRTQESKFSTIVLKPKPHIITKP